MDKVMQRFMHTPEFKQITMNPEVIMVYIGGSRVTSLHHDHSDYDVVIVATSKFNVVSFGMPPHVQKEFHMHCYIDLLSSFLCSNCTTWGRCISWMHLSVLTDDNILYKNPLHMTTIHNLFSMQEEMFKYGASSLLLMYENEIRRAISHGLDRNSLARKILYHITYAAVSLLNGGHPSHSLSNEDFEFIRRIKTGYRGELSMEDYHRVIGVLEWCIEHVDELLEVSNSIHSTLYNLLVEKHGGTHG